MRAGGSAFTVRCAFSVCFNHLPPLILELVVLPSRKRKHFAFVGYTCQFHPSPRCPCFFYCYYYGSVALRGSGLSVSSFLKAFNCLLPVSAFCHSLSLCLSSLASMARARIHAACIMNESSIVPLYLHVSTLNALSFLSRPFLIYRSTRSSRLC